MYKRTIDFMDEAVFPVRSLYAQNENPKIEIARGVHAERLENQQIIDFVVDEMKNTIR